VLALDSNTTAITHTSCIVGAGLAPALSTLALSTLALNTLALNTLALSARALESPDSASVH
jgi:hypothetical protein